MPLRFSNVLRNANQKRGYIICGLDPVAEKMPAHVWKQWHFNPQMAVLEFLIPIIRAVAPHVAGFKPNLSFFLAFDDVAHGKFYGQEALSIVCRYIREHYPDHVLILDSKDGDIGASNYGYFGRALGYGAHAVTWNPYLGTAVVEQMKQWPHLGVIVLGRTSNPEGTEFQTNKLEDGRTVFESSIDLWVKFAREGHEIAFVAGATYPEDLRRIRKKVGALPLLVPGVGKQGGNVHTVYKAAFGGTFGALMINVSSDIIYSDSGDFFAAKAGYRAKEYSIQVLGQSSGIEEP